MTSTALQALTAAEAQALAEAEAVIEAQMNGLLEAMQALATIHQQRLYRATHPTFEAYVGERWNLSRSQGHRMVRAGAVLASLAEADVSHACDISGRALDVLASVPEGERAAVYTEAVSLAGGTPTAGDVQEAASIRRSAFDDPGALSAFRQGNRGPRPDLPEGDGPDKPHPWDDPLAQTKEPEAPRVNNVGRMAAEGKTTDEWHTPESVLALARAILERIDVDPASCRIAQDRVRAGRWFGPVENGLVQPWEGRVWLNPPFSDMETWVDAAIERVQAGGDTEAVLLCCHANTENTWWHKLAAYPVALSRGRVRYLRPDGTTGDSPPRGTALFLLGGDVVMRQRFTAQALGGWDARLPATWGIGGSWGAA